MPLAFTGSRDLKIIETYTFNQTIAQKYPKHKSWNKFDHSNKDGFIRRLQMMKNWALSVDIIHKTQKYVLIDIKPENVLATDTGLISVVDTDSFQINDGYNVFKGPVATPEYFAKTAKQIQQQGTLQTTYCDMFALGVSRSGTSCRKARDIGIDAQHSLQQTHGFLREHKFEMRK